MIPSRGRHLYIAPDTRVTGYQPQQSRGLRHLPSGNYCQVLQMLLPWKQCSGTTAPRKGVTMTATSYAVVLTLLVVVYGMLGGIGLRLRRRHAWQVRAEYPSAGSDAWQPPMSV